ncbi:hypothetical protein ACIQHY_12300 [Streptomyces sp. NPDC092359]|uniref:hypothetical protein n=1 Tax=Streptomyces sp. NPDC092359 TaxID=3366014 RepID=UPI0038044D21
MILSSGQAVAFGSGPYEEFIIGDLLLTEDITTIAGHPILGHRAMNLGMPVTPR